MFKMRLAITLVMGVVYLFIDGQLFYYGKNNLPIYNPLPFRIAPEFRPDFDGGTVLWDEHKEAIVGKGVKYWSSNIIVDELLGYGFKNENLIAQVKDTTGSIYYVEVGPNKNSQSRQKIIIAVWSEAEKPKLDDYKWTEIKGNRKVEKLESYRFCASIIFIFSIIFLIGTLPPSLPLARASARQTKKVRPSARN